MKTLVIVVHPDLDGISVVNKRWTEELKKFPELFEVRELYRLYPDETIDVLAEQRVVERHEKIVFQFPVQWHSSPSLLKKWIDEVLTHGWAYGSRSGYRFANKKVALALSCSASPVDYSDSGVFRYTLEDFTRPFEMTFTWIKADYRPFYVFYEVPHVIEEKTRERIEQSSRDYLEFIGKL